MTDPFGGQALPPPHPRPPLDPRVTAALAERTEAARALTQQQERAALLLAMGQPVATVMYELHVDRTTVRRWEQMPAFAARVTELEAIARSVLLEEALEAVRATIVRETACGKHGTARYVLSRILFAGIVAAGHGEAIRELEKVVDAALKGFPIAQRWADRVRGHDAEGER